MCRVGDLIVHNFSCFCFRQLDFRQLDFDVAIVFF